MARTPLKLNLKSARRTLYLRICLRNAVVTVQPGAIQPATKTIRPAQPLNGSRHKTQQMPPL
jgi:hypothetical protein